MKKILTISLLLFSASAWAQDFSVNVDKLVSEKTFVFVSTASFTDQTKADTYGYGQIAFGPAPMSLARMLNYEKNSSLDRIKILNDYLDSSSKGAADKMSKNKVDEIAVVYLHNETAMLNPSAFQPSFRELIGRDPESINNLFAFENYTIKKNKKGNWSVKFDVEDELYSRNIFINVSPDGKAEMTISTAVKRFFGGDPTKQYYKGSLQEFAIL